MGWDHTFPVNLNTPDIARAAKDLEDVPNLTLTREMAS